MKKTHLYAFLLTAGLVLGASEAVLAQEATAAAPEPATPMEAVQSPEAAAPEAAPTPENTPLTQPAPAANSPVVMTKKPNGSTGQAVPVAGGTTLLSVMLALVAVVVMIFVTAWLIKRFTGLSPINNRQIKVVAALPVGARERVVLVDVGGQQLLLGVTPQQINTLHTFDEPVIIPDKPGNMDFAQRLQAMLSKGPTE